MINNLLPRLGTFLILVGFGFLVLFIGALLAGEINLLYLLPAVAAFFLGSVFHHAAPRPQSSRFSSVRKLSQRSHQRREEKQPEEDQEK